MKHYIYCFYAVLISTAFLFSCNQVDDSKSEIEIDTPTQDQAYFVGQNINISALLTNGSAIEQYKIELKQAYPSEILDSAIGGTIQFEQYSYLLVSDPGLQQTQINNQISIPNAFVPGNYNLIVSIINNSTSESKDTVAIKILQPADTTTPQIVMNTPLNGSIFNSGDTIHIQGTLSDLLSDNVTSGALHRTKITLIPQVTGSNPMVLFNNTNSVLSLFNTSYATNSNTIPGKYIIQILCIDEFNNYAISELEVTVQ
jgi:hypothetical protein